MNKIRKKPNFIEKLCMISFITMLAFSQSYCANGSGEEDTGSTSSGSTTSSTSTSSTGSTSTGSTSTGSTSSTSSSGGGDPLGVCVISGATVDANCPTSSLRYYCINDVYQSECNDLSTFTCGSGGDLGGVMTQDYFGAGETCASNSSSWYNPCNNSENFNFIIAGYTFDVTSCSGF